MSELILVKTPKTYTCKDGSNPRLGEQVVGIVSANTRIMVEYGYRPTGQEVEEELRLNDYAADKFTEFYMRCRVAKPEDRPFYCCHLLAWFITGSAADLQRYDNYQNGRITPVASTTLEAGKTYAIETVEGGLNHSMLGIERPDYSLSVLGDYSPMAVMNNIDLMTIYDGVAINQTMPISASFNA